MEEILKESYPDLTGDYISKCGQHLCIVKRIDYDDYEITIKGKKMVNQGHGTTKYFLDLL